MMFGAGLVFLVALKVIVHVAWVTILATLLQLIATFLLGCIAGNFVSIIAPYRIAAGSLKPTKTPVKTTS